MLEHAGCSLGDDGALHESPAWSPLLPRAAMDALVDRYGPFIERGLARNSGLRRRAAGTWKYMRISWRAIALACVTMSAACSARRPNEAGAAGKSASAAGEEGNAPSKTG